MVLFSMSAGGLHKMSTEFYCRFCQKIVPHIKRIITPNLPPNLISAECTLCGQLDFQRIREADNGSK